MCIYIYIYIYTYMLLSLLLLSLLSLLYYDTVLYHIILCYKLCYIILHYTILNNIGH